MMDDLALLPLQVIYQGMAFLRHVVHPRAGHLIDYYDATYVNGAIVNGRRIPLLFSLDLWNVYHKPCITFQGQTIL